MFYLGMVVLGWAGTMRVSTVRFGALILPYNHTEALVYNPKAAFTLSPTFAYDCLISLLIAQKFELKV